MVKVSYDPFKEIVILDKVKYELEEFIKVLGLSSGIGFANWANGIIFVYHSLPWSETTIKEALNGKLYWYHVAYADMPKYKAVLESKDGKIKIGIVNVSSSEIMDKVTKWLKVLEKLPRYLESKRKGL
ncbi:MAG: hypothetical protein QXX95_08015 [Nitrososphaerales archaeon]